jgi:glucokinase
MRKSAADPPVGSGEPDPTIGVDLGGTKMALAVVARDGRMSRVHRHPSDPGHGPDRMIRDLTDCLQGCLGPAGRAAAAVGIGVAGQVDRRGVVITSPNLGWRDVALRERVEDALHRPVTVTNDLRAITYGEWKFGAARGETDVVCIFVGTGIGGGIVADGRLSHGASETAGEVGHMTIVANGRRCHCPNSGCLEAYAGGWAIAQRAREAVRAWPADGARMRRAAGRVDAISAETVAEAARSGDPLARRLLDETAEYLAAGLVGVVNGLNPSVIVLGGGVIEGSPGLLRRAAALVRARALGVATRRLRIVRAGLGPRAGIMGAAALARAGPPGGS